MKEPLSHDELSDLELLIPDWNDYLNKIDAYNNDEITKEQLFGYAELCAESEKNRANLEFANINGLDIEDLESDED